MKNLNRLGAFTPSRFGRLFRDLPPLFRCQLLGPGRPTLLAAEPPQGYGMRVLAGLAGGFLNDAGSEHVHVLGLSFLA